MNLDLMAFTAKEGAIIVGFGHLRVWLWAMPAGILLWHFDAASSDASQAGNENEIARGIEKEGALLRAAWVIFAVRRTLMGRYFRGCGNWRS